MYKLTTFDHQRAIQEKKLSIYYINLIVLTINFHYQFEVILSWGLKVEVIN